MHAANLFTEQEANIFALLPRFQRRAKLQLPVRDVPTNLFRMEGELGSFQFFSIRDRTGLRTIQFASELHNINVITAMDAASRSFVLATMGQCATELHTRLGNIQVFNRVRLNATKHHQAIDLDENQWFYFSQSDGAVCFARLVLVVRVDGEESDVPLLFYQCGIADAAPTNAHGLLARRIHLDPRLMLLTSDMHASIRVACIIHDCRQANTEGQPCRFVDDYHLTTFVGGRKSIEVGLGIRHNPEAMTWFEAPHFFSQDMI